MVLSSKPKPADVDAIINRGGSVARTEPVDVVQYVQLRMSSRVLAEIDELRRRARVKMSRHCWLLMAIEERLARETKRLAEEE